MLVISRCLVRWVSKNDHHRVRSHPNSGDIALRVEVEGQGPERRETGGQKAFLLFCQRFGVTRRGCRDEAQTRRCLSCLFARYNIILQCGESIRCRRARESTCPSIGKMLENWRSRWRSCNPAKAFLPLCIQPLKAYVNSCECLQS